MSERLDPRNLSCYGTARILVEDLGGPDVARIYELMVHIGEEEPLEHAYVILNEAHDKERPLNEQEFAILGFTVGLIRRRGKDVTEKILKTPWSKL